MHRHAVVLGIAFTSLAVVAVAAGWLFFEASVTADGWRSLGPVWPYVAGGLLLIAALTGFLLWLGAYAVRHGPDERP